MPTPGTDDESGNLFVEGVVLALRASVFDTTIDRVSEVHLPLDSLTPRGGLRVLEVGHVCACTRLEGADHHLGVAGRTRNRDSSALKVRRCRPTPPAAPADAG